MVRGSWTGNDGTRAWFESEFEGILPIPDLPDEGFACAVVKTALPHGYQMMCLTVQYQKFRMGVQLIDPEKFQPELFGDVLYGPRPPGVE